MLSDITPHQWFSNLCKYRTHLKVSCDDAECRVSDLIDLGWGPRICISSQFSGTCCRWSRAHTLRHTGAHGLVGTQAVNGY